MYRRKPAGPLPWGKALPRRQSFAFGFRYTHFWYVLQPRPPFRTLAVSREFCLASSQDSHDCESVQFISGLALRHAQSNSTHPVSPRSLVVAYGVNDCETRLGQIDLTRIWQMLRPMPNGGGDGVSICES